MKVIDCEQMSPEWYEARRGIPTASNFDRIIQPTRMKLSTQAEDYAAELIGERICLNPSYFTSLGRPVSQAMQHGIDTEPTARRWYEYEKGVEVPRVGFCLSDCGRWGCSPDGLVGEDGAVEIKCPLPKTQVRYLLADKLPPEYAAQVHGQLFVTGRKWVDFLSYTEGFRPLLVRVVPDDFTFKLAECLEAFWVLFQDMLKKVG